MKSLNDWKQSYLKHTNVHAHKHSPEKQSLAVFAKEQSYTALTVRERPLLVLIFNRLLYR